MMALTQQKKRLRTSIKNLLGTLSTEQKFSAGELIKDHIAHWLDHHNDLKNIAFFVSLTDELSTVPINELFLMRNLCRIIPMATKTKSLLFIELPLNIHLGDFSWTAIKLKKIYPSCQTIEPESLDAILIPGLAFDLQGHRLGRGLGYYDKTLAQINKLANPILIGLAMDEQIVDHIPTEQHDIIMDYICTPKLGLKKSEAR
jgi:5-formyltetrahydrofolate cyclo-ligase